VKWFFLLLAACGSADEAATSPCGPTHVTVDRVIDGDTIVLTTGERVRYLNIDANEITNGHDDCWGDEARTLNESLVAGQEVDLAFDEQCTDVYGRLLAYVTVADREVNSLLVERGYACSLYIPPDGAARRLEFQALEAQAKAARAGMWGACQVVECAGK
jgi:micrococcal nuclease